ncbi:unnamed protein product [Symbiodinium natans]|uniref:Uncharacterized protein n=1 Tax=Symbiodinium natans TaxID=878477 RepID=A0A812S781_9DINO|nr:unnamed protein product [Symbiodinium natans]
MDCMEDEVKASEQIHDGVQGQAGCLRPAYGICTVSALLLESTVDVAACRSNQAAPATPKLHWLWSPESLPSHQETYEDGSSYEGQLSDGRQGCTIVPGCATRPMPSTSVYKSARFRDRAGG